MLLNEIIKELSPTESAQCSLPSIIQVIEYSNTRTISSKPEPSKTDIENIYKSGTFGNYNYVTHLKSQRTREDIRLILNLMSL